MTSEVTILLQRSRGGDPSAWSELVTLVYAELRRLASRQLRGSQPATMHTTRLVHDAYLRLADAAQSSVQDRSHFFALASTVMRQVLCDAARARLRDKRGGGVQHKSLDDAGLDVPIPDDAESLVAVDDALRALEDTNPRWARVVECRFFAGLSEQETSDALDLPLRTVQRDWQLAKAHLATHLG